MEASEFQRRFRARIAADPTLDALPLLREELSEFVTFDEIVLRNHGLHSNDAAFLLASGLPRQAPPFLSFSAYSENEIQDLYTLWGMPRTLFPLGGNGSGDPLGIEVESRAIVYLNHDDGMRRVFISSSVNQFAESLCCYQEALASRRLKGFLCLLETIDHPASLPGTMWHTEVVCDLEEHDG